jgi:hypothetical protein
LIARSQKRAPKVGVFFLGVRKYVLESAAFVWAMQQAVQAVDRKSLKGAIRYDA